MLSSLLESAGVLQDIGGNIAGNTSLLESTDVFKDYGINIEGIDESSIMPSAESATTTGQTDSEDRSTTQVGCFILIFGTNLQCYILAVGILCPVVVIAGVLLALKYLK